MPNKGDHDDKRNNKKLLRTTLEQKIMIIDYFKSSNKPQNETVEHFKDQFSISTSSFSDWLKHEDELRERYSNASNRPDNLAQSLKDSKRKGTFKYGAINEEMLNIVNYRLNNNLPVTEPILREYWSKFAKQYGVTDPKRLDCFSHGWLANFKKKVGLTKLNSSSNQQTKSQTKSPISKQQTRSKATVRSRSQANTNNNNNENGNESAFGHNKEVSNNLYSKGNFNLAGPIPPIVTALDDEDRIPMGFLSVSIVGKPRDITQKKLFTGTSIDEYNEFNNNADNQPNIKPTTNIQSLVAPITLLREREVLGNQMKGNSYNSNTNSGTIDNNNGNSNGNSDGNNNNYSKTPAYWDSIPTSSPNDVFNNVNSFRSQVIYPKGNPLGPNLVLNTNIMSPPNNHNNSTENISLDYQSFSPNQYRLLVPRNLDGNNNNLNNNVGISVNNNAIENNDNNKNKQEYQLKKNSNVNIHNNQNLLGMPNIPSNVQFNNNSNMSNIVSILNNVEPNINSKGKTVSIPSNNLKALSINEMEKLLFIDANAFFKRFKSTDDFKKSQALFDEFKNQFMADKLEFLENEQTENTNTKNNNNDPSIVLNDNSNNNNKNPNDNNRRNG